MARVIDRCPPWLYGKIRDLMGEQMMRSLAMGTERADELRRCIEALEWLNLPVRLPVPASGAQHEESER